jgi:tRNA(adenine34) deaminase
MKDDAYWMGVALREARKAGARGEVPIGAVVVLDGSVLGKGHNLRESKNDPTAHAEIIAIRQAARKIGGWRLSGAALYVTLEPCSMCMGAMILARLSKVVFATHDPKAGAAGSLYDLATDRRLNHQIEVIHGVRSDECSSLLSGFFADLRARKKRERL